MNRRGLLLGRRRLGGVAGAGLAACAGGRGAPRRGRPVVGDRGAGGGAAGPRCPPSRRAARPAEAAAARPASSTTSTTTTVTLSRPPPSLARRTSSLRGVGRVGEAAQHRGDRRLGHLVEQAVGAQHEAVAVVGHDRHAVDRHVVVDAEHPGEDVALRVDRGLLGRQAALAHEVGDQAVVVGELLELVAAPGGRRGSRRRWRWPGSARPARRRPGRWRRSSCPCPPGRGRRCRRRYTAALAASTASTSPSTVWRGVALVDGLAGDGRGDLAAPVPAHAVGDGPEADVLAGEVVVLVVRPDTADVAGAAPAQLDAARHGGHTISSTVLPICSRSRRFIDHRAGHPAAVEVGAVGRPRSSTYQVPSRWKHPGVDLARVGVVDGHLAPRRPPERQLVGQRVQRGRGGRRARRPRSCGVDRPPAGPLRAAGAGPLRPGGGGLRPPASGSPRSTPPRSTRKKNRYSSTSRKILRRLSSCSGTAGDTIRRRHWR